MIIDDDRDIVENLEMILEANGYQVAVKWDTENLEQAVSECNPDLIVLDIMFPEDPQAGFTAARALHNHPLLSKIPIILLSAVNQKSNMSFGFSDSDISDDFMPVKFFIEKPVRPKAILEKIKSLL
jgi:CheY-like chemotaxis protein